MRRAIGARPPIRRYLVRVSFWGRLDARSETEARAMAVHTMCSESIKDLPFKRAIGPGFWWDNQTIYVGREGEFSGRD